MTAWIALNSTVRFFLELCAFLALMYWGIHTGDSMAEGIVIGASAPGAAIFAWWKLAAPKSASRLTDTGRFLVEMAVFGLSALALAATGQTLLAISFAVAAVLNASFFLRRAQELTTSRLRDRPLRGPRLGHRPRLHARFLCWTHCRRPLRVVATVTCKASLWLPASFYDEALHAGPTEPAALTLRYPLLIRDAVDEPL